jgi:hypothetical protein
MTIHGMNSRKKIILAIASLALAAVFAAGCSAADVVLKYSPGSLDAITTAYPDLVRDNTKTDHYYYLTVDGTATMKISHDYSLTGKEDLVMETALKPFTDAGLDASKLSGNYRADGDKLLLVADDGNGTGMKDTVRDSLYDAVKYDRKNLTYHQQLDHYGVKLPAGKIEWAKDYKTNDKDIVFVIFAKPLADIGVDVKNISGWTFKTMQDTDGSNIDVLLKSYDLR